MDIVRYEQQCPWAGDIALLMCKLESAHLSVVVVVVSAS
jgi:hypothetical protein